VRSTIAALVFAAGIAVGFALDGARVGALPPAPSTCPDAPPATGRAAEVARLFQARAGDLPRASAPDGDGDDPAAAEGPEPDGAAEAVAVPDAPVGSELDDIRAGLATRARMARQALIDGADPDAEQLAALDASIAAMNADLQDIAEDFVRLHADAEPRRGDLMRFAADALDVLIVTEDTFTDALTPEQRDALPEEALDPLSYVDAGLVDVLAGLDR
jgi:hypothetical protein